MTPGAVIVVGAWSALGALILYGLSFDLRHWLANRRRRTDAVQRHPFADSSWPDAPTLQDEKQRLLVEEIDEQLLELKQLLERAREVGELEDLYALTPYRGRND